MLNNTHSLRAACLPSGRIQLSHRPAPKHDSATGIENGFTQPWRLEHYHWWDGTKHRRYPVLKILIFSAETWENDKKPLGNIAISIACDANYSHYQAVSKVLHIFCSPFMVAGVGDALKVQ